MKKLKKLLHDYLGWGFPKEHTGGDGFQPVYSCQFCEKELAYDSQGNCFHLIKPKL